MRTLIPILSLFAVLVTSKAHANFGWIRGTLEFASQQGNYCKTTSPDNMDCTASRYPAADAVGTQPVKDTEIVLRANNQTIGIGFTDRDGGYTVLWDTGSGNPTPASITIRWNLRHKDGRFRVTNSSDVLWTGDFQTEDDPIHNDTVDADPGFWSFTEVNNIYDGAQRMWWEALSFSGLMVSRFTDVRMRFPDTLAAANNAAAFGATKIIAFNGNNAQRPQGRVSHEMGHIASYLAEPYSFCGGYNYCVTSSGSFPCNCTGNPNTNCTGPWNLGGSEHHCAGFEEGMATFLGDVAYYWGGADAPTTCISTGLCTAAADNAETSPGTTCDSDADQRRVVMNVVKYLRDVYDSVDDPVFVEDATTDYWQMVAHLDEFIAAGVSGEAGNDGINEPWNTAITSIDDQDGRSTRDYRRMVDVDTSTEYANNCSPGGD